MNRETSCRFYEVENYSALKTNKFQIYTAIWMNPKHFMLAKEGRYQRIHIICFYLYEVLEKAKLIYSDTNQISDCLWKDEVGKDVREFSG